MAVNLLPLHHPLRNAEDAATLDVLSHGRLAYGAGRGSIPLHFAGYHVPLDESRQRFLEILDILLLAWTTDTFSYDGHYSHYHNIQVVPKPVQKPHPPLRIACNRSESFQLAGERGWRLFCSPVVVPMPRLEADPGDVPDAAPDPGHGPAGRGSGAHDLGLCQHVGDQSPRGSRRASEHRSPGAGVLGQMRQASLASDTVQATPRARERQARWLRMTYPEAADTFAIYGAPAYGIERIQACKDMFGINQFIPRFNAGG